MKSILKSKDVVGEKLRKYLGWSKTNTSDEELRKVREKVGKEAAKEFGIKLD